MSTPDDPNVPVTPSTSTGGQQPTSTPHGGQTAADASPSIRERLRSPGPQSSGGETRGSDVTSADFQQTDSRAELHGNGRDERQLAQHATPVEQPIDREVDAFELGRQARAEKVVAALFLMSLLGTIGFVLVYFLWEFAFEESAHVYYTPLLGITMAMALTGIGAGAVVWAKNLMDDEETTQERYPFGSSPEDRKATGTALKAGLAETQLPRRKLLRNTLLLSGGALAVLPVPFLFGLGNTSGKEATLATTGWREGVRLIRKNGSPVNRDDLTLGAVESVFPDVPRGTKLADSAALLIRMRPEDLKVREGREDWSLDGYVCYSAICTHLGCPVKLYEQQTHHLLCPCHQSTFTADDAAEVIFGPAARPLPQLAISVDDEGYFIARGDFSEPVGPSYWERTS